MDIFAGSLPFKLKEEELKQLFEPYGEVTSAKIIIDKVTRQNKGFGFIEMPNEQEALKAIEALNGFEVLGRTIVVNKSEKKENRGESRGNDRKPDFRSSSNNGGGYNKGNSSNSGGYNKGGFNKNKGGGFNRGNKRDDYRDDNNY